MNKEASHLELANVGLSELSQRFDRVSGVGEGGEGRRTRVQRADRNVPLLGPPQDLRGQRGRVRSHCHCLIGQL